MDDLQPTSFSQRIENLALLVARCAECSGRLAQQERSRQVSGAHGGGMEPRVKLGRNPHKGAQTANVWFFGPGRAKCRNADSIHLEIVRFRVGMILDQGGRVSILLRICFLKDDDWNRTTATVDRPSCRWGFGR